MTASSALCILHVAAPGPAGGLESVVLELTSGMCAMGHRVSLAAVIAPGRPIPPLATKAEALGVELHRVVVPGRGYWQEYRQLRRVIRMVAPDLVHTHGYRADLIGGFAARNSGVPWVSTVHGFTGGGRKNKLYEWLQTRSYRYAHGVVAVSQPLRRRLEDSGIPNSRLIVLPNGWSPKPVATREHARHILGLATGGPVVGWVGRLSREKGADVFLDAIGALSSVGVRASIIGGGAELLALQERAASLGIAEQVSWHGMIPDAAGLFAAFDLFVLSSRTEGTPIALFEAIAAGVPVVATSVGGVPDVISQEEARLVSPENPTALAEAIEAALSDPVGSATRTRAARHRLKDRFSAEAWLTAHVTIYRNILEGKGRLE